MPIALVAALGLVGLPTHAQFGPRAGIGPSAEGANSVFTADLDGDGDEDVLSASPYDDKIAWYENLGGGAFGLQQVVTEGALYAQSVHASDLDGDGDVDVLWASLIDNSVAWQENWGGGVFGSPQVITTVALGAASVCAADLDGDGDPDVLSASKNDGKVAWYENDGGGSFGPQQSIQVGESGVSKVYAPDLDGDGDPDVLWVAEWGSRIAWRENQGGGSFGPLQVITDELLRPASVHAKDLDGDGDLDLLSASVDGVAVHENLGGGVFGAPEMLTEGGPSYTSIYASDLDGDGDQDALAASDAVDMDSTLTWYANDGTGSFGAQHQITALPQRPLDIRAADLDGDGDPDLLSASQLDGMIAWHRNQGCGTFAPLEQLAGGPFAARALDTPDLDGDGAPDVLAAASPGSGGWRLGWYTNSGTGVFGPQRAIAHEPFDVSDTLGVDLDGDMDTDVLLASKPDVDLYGQFDYDVLAWCENLGRGRFGPRVVITFSADDARSVHAADLDGDGDVDALTACNEGGKIAWYENLGGGVFGPQRVVSDEAFAATDVYSGDLDGDGDEDVLSASNPAYGEFAWYENLGGGAFGPMQLITTGAHPANSVYSADLDGDGDLDVLADSSSALAWYENLGGGSFGSQRVLVEWPTWHMPIFPFPLFVMAGPGGTASAPKDLDGDGDLDVVASLAWSETLCSGFECEYATGARWVWFENLGGGIFTPLRDIETQTQSWLGAVAGPVVATDLDADGDVDVISAWLRATFWYENLVPPIPPAEVEPYGCEVNPVDSLVVLSGGPSPGSALVFGVDNPLGTQTPGSLPWLVFSGLPDPAFPCGTLLPGFGMSGSGPGELLLDPKFFAILFGPAWDGSAPAPIPFSLPNSPTILGLEFYAQGLMLDSSPGSAVPLALTTGLRLTIGP